MEFEADLNTEFLDPFPDDEDEDEKNQKIKKMLKDLINESKQIIKENEKKFTEEQELLENLPKLPAGIKVKINRQKSSSIQQKNSKIQPTIKKTFPDPFNFKTNLPVGIKIVKLKKKSSNEAIQEIVKSPPPPHLPTPLDCISKLPSGIKIVKLNKNQKIVEKPVPLNNFPKLPPGIKVTQLKKPPVILEESEKMEESYLDDDFIYESDFEKESSPIIEQRPSTPLIEIKCGVCEMIFNSLELLENHSDFKKGQKRCFKKRVEPIKAKVNNNKLSQIKSWSKESIKQLNSSNLLNQNKLITIKTNKKLPQISFVKCKLCPAYYNNLDEMKNHICKEQNEKQIKKHEAKVNRLKNLLKIKKFPKNYICPICDEVGFKTLKAYNNHMLNEHKTVKQFPCIHCGKILLTEIALNSHMTLAHLDKVLKIHKCTHCDMDPFCSEDLLNNHIFKIHPEIKHEPIRNTCEICGKLFDRYDKKERHLREVHTNITNFVCDICGILFKSTNEVSHKRTHFEGTFPCDQCDVRFRHRQDLIIHKRLHTGERPYECTICHERFVASSNLNKHLKSRHVVKTGISVE